MNPWTPLPNRQPLCANIFVPGPSFEEAHLKELSKTFNTIRVYTWDRAVSHHYFLDRAAAEDRALIKYFPRLGWLGYFSTLPRSFSFDFIDDFGFPRSFTSPFSFTC